MNTRFAAPTSNGKTTFKTRHMRLLRVGVMLYAATFLALAAGDVVAADDPIAGTLAKIVAARDTIRGYVSDVAKSHMPNDPAYIKARDLYRTALGKYNGWSAAVTDAVIAGSTKHLNTDKTYAMLADDATQASAAFLNYADSLEAESKGVSVSILGDLADAGIKIWNAIRASNLSERQARAANFKAATTWPQWEDILSPPSTRNDTKAPPDASPDESKKK